MLEIVQEPVVAWTLRSFLAVLFASAALSKLTAIDEFHGVVRNFRLLPDALARPVAMVLPVVELAVAAGLLIGPLARPAALVAAALLAVFGLAIAINVLRGRSQIDCGCFRNGMKQRISWATVGRNVVLTALALGAGALLATGRAAGPGEIATGLVAGLTLTLLYLGAEMLGGLVAMNNRASSTKGR
ncbi:MauE/DoxX family redox-associated membrane protein [Paracoccus sp. NGMCC 1.201697]|uniref:Methylamine utilization protein MauE n=1 Tax=Paracoccus broussonetiae subsp. drimophilus TaxID=3373869 RepID=A0ABW7LL64_9RHOB